MAPIERFVSIGFAKGHATLTIVEALRRDASKHQDVLRRLWAVPWVKKVEQTGKNQGDLVVTFIDQRYVTLEDINRAVNNVADSPVEQIVVDQRRPMILLVALRHKASPMDIERLQSVRQVRNVTVAKNKAYGGKLLEVFVPTLRLDGTTAFDDLRQAIHDVLAFQV